MPSPIRHPSSMLGRLTIRVRFWRFTNRVIRKFV
jgi:hypothetical protein